MKAALLRAKNAIGLALRIVLSVAIVTLIIWKFQELQNLDVREFIDNTHLSKTIFTLFGVYAVKGVCLVIPASLIYIVIGMSLPVTNIFSLSVPLIALLVNTMGIIIEVSVTYLMGIILGGPFVTKKLKASKYGEKIFDIYDKHEKSAVFIMRILGLPIDFCSLFLGAMRSKFLPYLGMSLAGILPRVILFTILGDKVYDLIPMKYVISVAAVALAAFLVYSTIKYAIKSAKSEESFGKPAYTPICEEKRKVILDTDIGADCDDAGAIALLFEYLKKYDAELLGICSCTSDPYAIAVIKAIAEYYKYENLTVGAHKGVSILPDVSKFTRPVTKMYCKYESSACAAIGDVEFYESLLKNAEDDSVTVITIGMFTNISAILNKDPILFNKKVHSIVSMGGKYPKGKEYNIEKDPLSAENVLEKYRGMIVFNPFEVGEKVMTGFNEHCDDNPVFDCYNLYKNGKIPCLNSSWDLITVQYAFEGNGEFYALSKPMAVTVNMDGEMTVKKDRNASNYFIIKKANNENIEEYLNNMLRGKQEYNYELFTDEEKSEEPVVSE